MRCVQTILQADSEHMQQQQRVLHRASHYTVQVLDQAQRLAPSDQGTSVTCKHATSSRWQTRIHTTSPSCCGTQCIVHREVTIDDTPLAFDNAGAVSLLSVFPPQRSRATSFRALALCPRRAAAARSE